MKIWIQVKKIGKKLQQLSPCAFELPGTPETLRELIAMLVEIQVFSYHSRLNTSVIRPLTEEEIADLAVVGKIGFGIPFGSATVKPEDAVRTAISGFDDGLYRVFIGDQEAVDLDAPLDLQEDHRITILRLVMLTGGFC